MDNEINWEQTYRAAMDSVNLLRSGKPDGASEEEWARTVEANVGHLKIILERAWPEGFDLEPFESAINLG